MQKSLLTRIGETIGQHRQERQARVSQPAKPTNWPRLPGIVRWFLPNGGTLLLIALFIFTQNGWASPMLRTLAAESAVSTGTIAYQGRLADSGGNPLTSTLNMDFRFYAASTGGAPLWTEQWTGSNGVKVSDGLFNIMLGSLTPIPQNVITGNSTLFLGITVGSDDEMSPRVQLASVPFSLQALTVPDGSITGDKIANETITAEKLADSLGGVPLMAAHMGQYSTSSTVWADIDSTSLSLTVNSQTEQKWLILSTIPGVSLSSGAPGWVNFDLAIDGTRVSNSVRGLAVAESSMNYQGTVVTMSWVATLGVGTHTIRPQWRAETSGDSPITSTATFTLIAIPF